MRIITAAWLILISLTTLAAQSRRVIDYSESQPPKTSEKPENNPVQNSTSSNPPKTQTDDVIRVDTDLIVVNARISERGGNSVQHLKKNDFQVFENGVNQQIAYFSNEEQPFTVALILDTSYSSVVKLADIQAAAKIFISQLRENDRVLIVSVDETVRVLCGATNNRKALQYAIDATKVGSGTSLYDSLDQVLTAELKTAMGRKAVVILSDGVDTTSRRASAEQVLRRAADSDLIVFPIEYNTFADVQKNRKESAEIYYDDWDRRIIVEAPERSGERKSDYKKAVNFLRTIAEMTGGTIYSVDGSTNLSAAFAAIADELRKIYSLGYYSADEKQVGAKYQIKVRVYRPNLIIKTRDSLVWKP